MEVSFHSYENFPDERLTHAVIVARHRGKWIFVRHRERESFELPGGRREAHESILQTAHRELREETGAGDFHLVPLDVYDLKGRGAGLLCYAEIRELGELPRSEIREVHFLDEIPAALTHPIAHPRLFARGREKMQLLAHFDDYEHIIWDWNGTLLNDLAHTLSVTNRLLEKYKLPLLTQEQYQKIFRFPIRTYYQDLGYDLERLSFAELCDEFMAEYNRDHAKNSRLFENAREILQIVRHTKRQSILSAAAQSDLDEMMRHHGIAPHFHAVYGIADNQASSKLARGKELLAQTEIPAEKTLLIGDTDHDLEVGQALGVDVLLIADGHQCYSRLSALHSRVLPTRQIIF